jgi:predicted nucleic acid-binding protein
LAGFFIGSDAFADRAKALLAGLHEPPVVSDFVVAEFASVVARLARMNGITRDEARETFALFDGWRAQAADGAEIGPADTSAATAIIRRLDLNLRAPDAINLAVAMRLGAAIATFDSRMADNARALGIILAAA